MRGDAVRPLLENKIVLIKPVGVSTVVTGFQDIIAAPVIALGDPASVPAALDLKPQARRVGYLFQNYA